MSIDKVRYFTFLLYPESILENWETELELMNIPMAINPLHSRDRSNVEGQEHKKVHYHVIYIAANPVTIHSAHKRIQRALGNKSIARVQVVKQSIENMHLYLTHENKNAIAKSKYKYAKKDIKLLNNFDIGRYVVFDIEDKEEMLNDVCDMIDDHGSADIRELRRFMKEHGSDYNLPSTKIIDGVLRSYAGLIRLCFSVVHRKHKYGQSCVDTHVGEIKR